MQEYNWIDMMNKMQELRLFCSLTVRGAKKEGLTSAQELDLLSRAVLSKVPLTPQEFSISMDTLPLNPINPDNARILRITAAAGTELADPYSYGTYKIPHVEYFIPI